MEEVWEPLVTKNSIVISVGLDSESRPSRFFSIPGNRETQNKGILFRATT